MLRLFLIYLFCSAILSAGAQNQRCPDFKKHVTQHEIGLTVYSLTEIPYTIYHYSVNHDLSFHRGYSHSILHGLMYKYTVDYKHSFRGGFGYSTVSDNSSLDTEDYEFSNRSVYHGTTLRLGYQYTFLHWRRRDLSFYASVDVTGMLGNHKGNEMIFMNSDTIFDRRYNARINEAGIAPAVGIYYHIDKEWSISLESGFNWIRYSHSDLDFRRRDSALQFQPIRALSLHYWF
jgi:hypothetical protein